LENKSYNNPISKALKKLQQKGNKHPKMNEVVSEMGVKTTPLNWNNSSKEAKKKGIYNPSKSTKKYPSTYYPILREFFYNNEFIQIEGCSKNRAIFSNGELYVVESITYGHAIYIFKNLVAAQLWAENKIDYIDARLLCFKRITHHEGWKKKMEQIKI
jgi:hypothetical protein